MVNFDSPIAYEVAAILLSIETISKTVENTVNGNRLSIRLTSSECSRIADLN